MFGADQGLPEDKILDPVELLLPCEFQKELLIQWLDYAIQGLTEIVEFSDRLETDTEIFQTQVEVPHLKKLSSPVNATNLPSWSRSKGHTRLKTIEIGC